MNKLSAAKHKNKSGNQRGLNPNSLANLKRGRKWKRGESGNPKGRPSKGTCITSLIREMLDEPVEGRFLLPADKNKGLTWRQVVARAILTGASVGNPALVKELLERLEGRVTQPIEGGIEITDARNLSDEELAVIAAEKILRDNATGSRKGTPKKTGSTK